MFTKYRILFISWFFLSLLITVSGFFVSPFLVEMKVMEMHQLTEVYNRVYFLNNIKILFGLYGDFKPLLFYILLYAGFAIVQIIFLVTLVKGHQPCYLMFFIYIICNIVFAISIIFNSKIFSIVNSYDLYSNKPFPDINFDNIEDIIKNIILDEIKPNFQSKYLLKISGFGSFCSIFFFLNFAISLHFVLFSNYFKAVKKMSLRIKI